MDPKVKQLTAGQYLVVARRQLLAAGVSKSAIGHALATERLHRVHAGVYALVPIRRLESDGHFMAAVLACGDDAVLSHRAAAAHWDLRPTPEGSIDVTTRYGRSHRRNGVSVHTSRCLTAEDVAVRRGIPCTSVARTLLDLAGCVSRRVLDRAVEQSIALQLYDHAAVTAVLERARGRRGASALRRVIEGIADEPVPARSELERRFLELVRDGGLPTPIVNGVVCGYEVDFRWPAQRLIVETDGRSVHGTPQAFERDRRRDLDLELAGWHVLRFGWRQIMDDPHQVVTLLRRRLGR